MRVIWQSFHGLVSRISPGFDIYVSTDVLACLWNRYHNWVWPSWDVGGQSAVNPPEQLYRLGVACTGKLLLVVAE